MSYLLIFGGVKAERRMTRLLRRVARKLNHQLWEFRSFSELEGAARALRGMGARPMAFSKRDEIILSRTQVKSLVDLLGRGKDEGKGN